jgi:Flp pilus assembly CpaE family ATPase
MQSVNGVESIGLVLNRYDERATLDKKEIEETVGLRVMARFSDEYRAAVDAANKGEPIVASKTELSRSFERFARELSRVPGETPMRGSGMLSRVGASIAAALHGGV